MARKLTRWFNALKEKPTRVGWYNTRVRGRRGGRGRRYWNGAFWSWPVVAENSDGEMWKRAKKQTGVPLPSLEWQGRHEEPMDVDWVATEPTGKSVYPDTD